MLSVRWLLACIAEGSLFVQFYKQSTQMQMARAESEIALACGLVRDGYEHLAGSPASALGNQILGQTLRDDLAVVFRQALAHQEGVEDGIHDMLAPSSNAW